MDHERWLKENGECVYLPGTVSEDNVEYSCTISEPNKSDVFDEVHKPEHYNFSGIECIDAIRASMTKEEFEGYLKGSVMKYLWRYRYKGKPLQDLAKAQWYLTRLVASTES